VPVVLRAAVKSTAGLSDSCLELLKDGWHAEYILRKYTSQRTLSYNKLHSCGYLAMPGVRVCLSESDFDFDYDCNVYVIH